MLQLATVANCGTVVTILGSTPSVPTHGGAGSAPPCAVRRACELSRGGAHRHVLLRLRGPCLLPGICVEIQSGEPVGVALKCNPGGLWVMRRICLSEESAIEKSSFEYIIVEDF